VLSKREGKETAPCLLVDIIIRKLDRQLDLNSPSEGSIVITVAIITGKLQTFGGLICLHRFVAVLYKLLFLLSTSRGVSNDV